MLLELSSYVLLRDIGVRIRKEGREKDYCPMLWIFKMQLVLDSCVAEGSGILPANHSLCKVVVFVGKAGTTWRASLTYLPFKPWPQLITVYDYIEVVH